jgi:predicted GIY-YIG superfamily endonuclease
MKSVYLIRGNDGKYKIGSANEPRQRLLQLQTGNSDKLELVGVYQSENARKIESALHRHYSYVRNVGEWFDLSVKEEVNFPKQCKIIDESIDLLKNMENKFV